MPKPADLSVTGLRRQDVLTHDCTCQAAAAAFVYETSESVTVRAAWAVLSSSRRDCSVGEDGLDRVDDDCAPACAREALQHAREFWGL
jgi:hypothetical protein